METKVTQSGSASRQVSSPLKPGGGSEDGAGVQAGVQSAEVGLSVLVALAENGGDLTLSALAARASMAPAKAHRYLVSLIRTGFVEQNARSGRYALSTQALRVGLVALGRLDVMEVATEAIYALRDSIDETVLLAIWGTHGATMVRWAEASQPVTVNVRIGSNMPLTRSATGQVFGAYLQSPLVKPILMAELKAPIPARSGIPTTEAAARKLFDSVRSKGMSQVDGQMLSGIRALGVPVFGGMGDLACVISVMGSAGAFDHSLDGSIATALRQAARSLSGRLGFTG